MRACQTNVARFDHVACRFLKIKDTFSGLYFAPAKKGCAKSKVVKPNVARFDHVACGFLEIIDTFSGLYFAPARKGCAKSKVNKFGRAY